MAAVFPLDTSKPWVFNGVTYEYDASEDRWHVVSTTATDLVVDSISNNRSQIDVLDTIIDQEIDNRTALLNAAAAKNNQQDAAILELDARVDAIGATAGILEFKGSYTYVLEKSAAACDSAYIECLRLADAGADPTGDRITCNRLYNDCTAAIGTALEAGTFTSIGTLDQSLTEELVIATADIDGTSYDWENLLEAGDYIEVVEQSQQDTALYEVVADPIRSGTEERIRVKHIKETGAGDGHFNLQEVSEIRVIKQSLGLDINEADKRYQQRPYTVQFSSTAPVEGQAEDTVLRNGELWYDTLNLELFVWNNNAWVTAAKPASQDIVVQDINSQVDALTSKAAGLEFEINTVIQDIVRSPHLYYSDEAPSGNVEGNLIDGDLWIDSNDLQIKFYSGGAWINPDRTSEVPVHNHFAPANLRWRFTENTDDTAPPDGYFKRDSSRFWRFSLKTWDGVDLGDMLITDTGSHNWETQMTVWYKTEENIWKMKAHYLLSEWRWNYDSGGSHTEFKQSSVHGVKLSNGSIYNVTIGGWW